jgi:hypothetical protein
MKVQELLVVAALVVLAPVGFVGARSLAASRGAILSGVCSETCAPGAGIAGDPHARTQQPISHQEVQR